MPDISTLWSPQLVRGDWQLDGTGKLIANRDLETAVVLSIFTDAEAHADDRIPDGTDNRRGWYGDDQEATRMGSRLWLIEREKITANLLPRIRGYITEALTWLVTDGVAASFTVEVELNAPNYVAARVIINRKDGDTVGLNFGWAWDQLGAMLTNWLTDDSGIILTDDDGIRLTP
jgi:phage gp46-like protein